MTTVEVQVKQALSRLGIIGSLFHRPNSLAGCFILIPKHGLALCPWRSPAAFPGPFLPSKPKFHLLGQWSMAHALSWGSLRGIFNLLFRALCPQERNPSWTHLTWHAHVSIHPAFIHPPLSATCLHSNTPHSSFQSFHCSFIHAFIEYLLCTWHYSSPLEYNSELEPVPVHVKFTFQQALRWRPCGWPTDHASSNKAPDTEYFLNPIPS